MALLHVATLTPTKLALVEAWVPSQPWFVGDGPLALVANFRFDDPLGEVGVETLLVRAGDGPVMQVPLTYRAEPLPGAEGSLIGTTEHSVLGTRWVYDGPGDPVYQQTLATTVLSGGTQVELWIDEGAGLVLRTPTATVVGGGTDAGFVQALPESLEVHSDAEFTVVAADGVRATVIRRPGRAVPAGVALTGIWAGVESVVVATVEANSGQIRPTGRTPIFSSIMAKFTADTGIPSAVRTGDTVYVTGHTGEDEDLSFSPDIEHQLRRAFVNIADTLAEAGGDWSDVVSIVSYHVGLRAQAETLLAVSREFLAEPAPAWSAVGVTELWDEGSLVEISCVAVIPAARTL
jgi:enamine deaminase RidA (YjgF/YER057c/UK114 family)